MLKSQKQQDRRKAVDGSQLDAVSSGYLYLDYLFEMQLSCPQIDTTSGFVRKFNHKFFTVLNQICCSELFGANEEKIATTATCSIQKKSSTSKISAFLRKAKFKWPEKLVLCLYGLFTCHVLIGLFYQYSRDLNLIRLMILRLNTREISFEQQVKFSESLPSSAVQLRSNGSQLERKLLNKVETSEWVLNAIGASQTRNSIASEMIHLTVVSLAFITFGLTTLYFRCVTQVELYHYREQVDYKQERNSLEQLVREVVRKYCASDTIFCRLHSALDHKAKNRGICNTQNAISKLSRTQLIGFNDYLCEIAGVNSNLKTSTLLDNMLASGALMPANRSAAWTRIRDSLLCAYELFMILFIISFFGMLVLVSGDNPFVSGMLDISIRGLILTVGLVSLSFPAAVFIASIDQSYLIKTLIKLIAECIQTNTAQFAEYCKSSQVKRRMVSGQIDEIDLPETQTLKMNANLLFTLMHYKIFVYQWRPVLRTLNPAPILHYMVLLSVPIIIKIHMPYMKLFQDQDNRLVLAGACAFMLLPINFGMLTVCHFNARCTQLYSSLSSLIAHIIKLETQTNKGGVYDYHALLTLLREVNQSDRFIDQFKLRFAGVSGTYSTLVKVHFWWGLVVISILLGARSNGTGTLDSIFDDPLIAFSI